MKSVYAELEMPPDAVMAIPLSKRMKVLVLSKIYGADYAKLSEKVGILIGHIQLILKHKNYIQSEWKYSTDPDVRLTIEELENLIGINELLLEWKRRAMQLGRKVTDADLQNKAIALKHLFRMSNFQVGPVWFTKFRNIYKAKLYSSETNEICKNYSRSLNFSNIFNDISWMFSRNANERFAKYLRIDVVDKPTSTLIKEEPQMTEYAVAAIKCEEQVDKEEKEEELTSSSTAAANNSFLKLYLNDSENVIEIKPLISQNNLQMKPNDSIDDQVGQDAPTAIITTVCSTDANASVKKIRKLKIDENFETIEILELEENDIDEVINSVDDRVEKPEQIESVAFEEPETSRSTTGNNDSVEINTKTQSHIAFLKDLQAQWDECDEAEIDDSSVNALKNRPIIEISDDSITEAECGIAVKTSTNDTTEAAKTNYANITNVEKKCTGVKKNRRKNTTKNVRRRSRRSKPKVLHNARLAAGINVVCKSKFNRRPKLIPHQDAASKPTEHYVLKSQDQKTVIKNYKSALFYLSKLKRFALRRHDAEASKIITQLHFLFRSYNLAMQNEGKVLNFQIATEN